MNSMTGFGRAEVNSKFGRFTVEISSVNSRFLESVARLPRPLASLEPQVRELLTSSVQRGKVSVFVNLTEPDVQPGDVIINRDLVKRYHRELKRLKKELKLGGEILVSDLLLLPEITRPERTEPDLEAIWPVLKKPVAKALKDLLAMRAREGKAMATDIRGRLKAMAGVVAQVEKATAGATEIYAQKLAGRIAELMNGQKHDPNRLEEEIAVFADRTDITEECIRLKSHLKEFGQTLGQKEAIGRRLNFILQEMNREVNTIGSKGAAFDISTKVISLKEEIEKIREQVQNVE
jgi:uncharacterized protein (TIGR00255 family)